MNKKEILNEIKKRTEVEVNIEPVSELFCHPTFRKYVNDQLGLEDEWLDDLSIDTIKYYDSEQGDVLCHCSAVDESKTERRFTVPFDLMYQTISELKDHMLGVSSGFDDCSYSSTKYFLKDIERSFK